MDESRVLREDLQEASESTGITYAYRDSMPTISAFYGILTRMHYNDHPPPHFHARYSDFEATVDLEPVRSSTLHCPSGLSIWRGNGR